MPVRACVKVAILVLAVSGSACVQVHSYVEDGYGETTVAERSPPAQPLPVRLETEFRRNGEPFAPGNEVLAREARSVLHRSGVLAVSEDGSAPLLLRLICDDHYDPQAARHSGFVQGFSAGTSGAPVEDRYDFVLSLKSGGSVLYSRRFQPVMATTGVEPVPVGFGKPYTANQAFYLILKSTLRQFLAGAPALVQ
jgi:hypothetical protein